MSSNIKKIQYDTPKHLLPARERQAHKGDFGHVLVIGGNKGFGGAALMAAMSAARSGAGLVSVATHICYTSAMLARCPELMVTAINNSDDLVDALAPATAVLLGPGLGQDEWGQGCLRGALSALAEHPRPLVLDADALNQISLGEYQEFLAHKELLVLTPHPGEAARLLNTSTREVQDDREAAATRLQAQYGGTVVLKGAGSLVCSEQHGRIQLEQCIHGNPGMASGGMGDVLAGVIVGLIAQGLEPVDAARLATCVHAKAGDIQAAAHGQRGMLATDLINDIRHLLNP